MRARLAICAAVAMFGCSGREARAVIDSGVTLRDAQRADDHRAPEDAALDTTPQADVPILPTIDAARDVSTTLHDRASPRDAFSIDGSIVLPVTPVPCTAPMRARLIPGVHLAGTQPGIFENVATPTIATDCGGGVHVLWQTATNVEYAAWNGATWTRSTVLAAPSESAVGLSVGRDGSAWVGVASCTAGVRTFARAADGSTWRSEVIAESAASGLYIGVVATSIERAHVIYQPGGCGAASGSLRHVARDSAGRYTSASRIADLTPVGTALMMDDVAGVGDAIAITYRRLATGAAFTGYIAALIDGRWPEIPLATAERMTRVSAFVDEGGAVRAAYGALGRTLPRILPPPGDAGRVVPEWSVHVHDGFRDTLVAELPDLLEIRGVAVAFHRTDTRSRTYVAWDYARTVPTLSFGASLAISSDGSSFATRELSSPRTLASKPRASTSNTHAHFAFRAYENFDGGGGTHQVMVFSEAHE